MTESTDPDKSTIDTKPYLDYIDKEMTLCGIITTFSLACILFMMDKLFSTSKCETQVFSIDFKSIYFLIALASFMIAAFLLFKQRAELAYYHGQISLESSSPGFTGKSIINLFREVDAWKFWYKYFYGIAFIACAFIEIAVLLINSLYKGCSIIIFLNQMPYCFFIGFAIVVLCMAFNYRIIKNYEKGQ